jgi:predicted dehydrogenase
MLDNEKEIDAVVIGTPDHMHAPIAAYAMKMGKHVYVEKPVCKTVFESRELRRIAKEMDVVTQMGNQGHASEGTRQTVEMVRSGAVGNITEVHAFTDVPSWPQGDLERPAAVPVPDTLDWDLWLGVAPVKPYHPDICHFNWRGLRDYGTGAMGDWGSHILDAPIWALELKWPTRIQASPTRFNDEFWPACEFITFEFPARGDLPPVKLVWFDGDLRPPRPDALEDGRRASATTYYGDKGVMMSGGRGSDSQLLPYTAMQQYTRPEPWLPRGTGDILEDWINAIKNGTKTSNDFEHSCNLGEIMALASVAVLASSYHTTLEYDGENMRFTNLPEANDLLHYEYRAGWDLL